MSSKDDSSIRDRWARLRLLIIGQVLAAPAPRGELTERLQQLSQQVWRHPVPAGDIRFGVSTLERWLALARCTPDPSAMLATVPRCDAGRVRSIDEALGAAIRVQYASHPKWTIQLHYDNLVATARGTQAPTPTRHALACSESEPDTAAWWPVAHPAYRRSFSRSGC